MSVNVVKNALLTELRRQANEDRGGTPWFDPEPDGSVAIIDGEVNMDKLAEAVVKALEAT